MGPSRTAEDMQKVKDKYSFINDACFLKNRILIKCVSERAYARACVQMTIHIANCMCVYAYMYVYVYLKMYLGVC